MVLCNNNFVYCYKNKFSNLSQLKYLFILWPLFTTILYVDLFLDKIVFARQIKKILK